MGLRTLFFGSLILLAATGCKKNAGCTEFGTENYDPDAIFDDGSCILARDKFIGNFNVNTDCSTDNYSCSIVPTIDDFTVSIVGLADTLSPIDAWIADKNITIEQQALNTYVTIEGAGVFTEDSTIELSFRVRDMHDTPASISDCFEVMSRQN